MWRLIAGSLAAALLVFGWVRTKELEPIREEGLLNTEPPIPYYRYLPEGAPRTRALVVHGLDSNKEFMQILCAALADAGTDVYAIDLPGHGDSTVPFNAVIASQTIAKAVGQIKPDTAIGHSLGASLLLDLADEIPFRSLVLISPGPTPLSDKPLPHTLVTTGRFDIPAVNHFVSRLDGVERRQFKWGAHSSAPLNPVQIREIVQWLGGDTSRLRTTSRWTWLGLTFAACLTLGMMLLPYRQRQSPPVLFSGNEVLVAFVFACAAGVIVLRFVLVLRWIRLFAADYLVSLLFVAGVVLMALARWRNGWSGFCNIKGGIRVHFIPALIGIAAASYVIVVIGLLTASRLIHMSLSDGRLWRFPIIAAASFPLFLFDEMVTRQVPGGWRQTMIGVLTRCLLGASLATGVLTLNRESSFMVLMTGLMLLFWVVLWFATHLVSRRVQDPIAGALFAALVQGWMFAAWFVTV